MGTDPKLTLLARVEKDGKPVHPGLRKPCRVEWPWQHPEPDADGRYGCLDCGGREYVPNPDPMAMIAACVAKELYPWVEANKVTLYYRQEHFGVYLVSEQWTWEKYEDLDIADAMVKATKALEPDNWEDCKWCRGQGTHRDKYNSYMHEECTHCAGTGIVIKEARDGN